MTPFMVATEMTPYMGVRVPIHLRERLATTHWTAVWTMTSSEVVLAQTRSAVDQGLILFMETIKMIVSTVAMEMTNFMVAQELTPSQAVLARTQYMAGMVRISS